MNYIMISYCVDDNMSAYLAMLRNQYAEECRKANVTDWEIIYDKHVIQAGQTWDDVIVDTIQKSRRYVYLQTEGFNESSYINTREIPLITEQLSSSPEKKYFHAKLFQCKGHQALSSTQSLLLDDVPLLNIPIQEFKASKNEVGMSAAIRELALLIFSAINTPLLRKEKIDDKLDYSLVYDIDRNQQKINYCSKMKNSPIKVNFFPYFSSSADLPESLCISLPKSAMQKSVSVPTHAQIVYDLNSPDALFKSEEEDFQAFLESFNLNLTQNRIKEIPNYTDEHVSHSTEDALFGRLNKINCDCFHFFITIEYFLFNSEEPFQKFKKYLDRLIALVESKLMSEKKLILFINFQRDAQSTDPTNEQIKNIIVSTIPPTHLGYLGVLQKIKSDDVKSWIEERLGADDLIKSQDYHQNLLTEEQMPLVKVVENIKTKAKDLLKVKSK